MGIIRDFQANILGRLSCLNAMCSGSYFEEAPSLGPYSFHNQIRILLHA